MFPHLLGPHILPHNQRMIPLIRLQSQLFLRLDSLFLQLFDFACEHCCRINSRIDTIGLDGNYYVAIVLEEVVSVERYDARLIWLCYVRENNVHHANEHAVFVRMPCVFDDGDYIRTLLGHVNEVAAGTVRKLNSVDYALL
ncbi:hypothetical protein BC936DRAFT_144675 [Jimgerdemannia flammicorona]|uniref:Uncharacterized protein n=2 Tax=Jimgerdemannia flammicorona TaxID=994334 RepID=A0A433Q452_9FUNG|nr:hypothetical protein BC936DRAFT_144675 [Jimgerdemannia flammicorona]RUS24512.1 hypothetical protein BC938DRAFT_473467 [Jimgerdemannia flammicorona]